MVGCFKAFKCGSISWTYAFEIEASTFLDHTRYAWAIEYEAIGNTYTRLSQICCGLHVYAWNIFPRKIDASPWPEDYMQEHKVQQKRSQSLGRVGATEFEVL